jgi:hypothetical protein
MFEAAQLILGGMNEPKKSRLDEAQLADAQRLRRLWDSYKAAGGLDQVDFAEEYGLKSQSNVGHYLQARQPLNIKAAIAFAKGMKIPIEAISPAIAAEIEDALPILRSPASAPKLPANLLELNGAEGQLIMFFRGLPPELQAHVLTDMNNQFNAHAGMAPSPANPYAKVGAPGSPENMGEGFGARESTVGGVLQADTVDYEQQHLQFKFPKPSKSRPSDQPSSNPESEPSERGEHVAGASKTRRTGRA